VQQFREGRSIQSATFSTLALARLNKLLVQPFPRFEHPCLDIAITSEPWDLKPYHTETVPCSQEPRIKKFSRSEKKK
jgi:hypothetical protein